MLKNAGISGIISSFEVKNLNQNRKKKCVSVNLKDYTVPRNKYGVTFCFL